MVSFFISFDFALFFFSFFFSHTVLEKARRTDPVICPIVAGSNDNRGGAPDQLGVWD